MSKWLIPCVCSFRNLQVNLGYPIAVMISDGWKLYMADDVEVSCDGLPDEGRTRGVYFLGSFIEVVQQ